MILCACNNRKCDGICREYNLLRPRKRLQCCPAAVGEGYINGRIQEKPQKRIG